MSESYKEHSPYNYALNDPIGKLDPNGMWVEIAGGYSTSNSEEIAAFLSQARSQQNGEGDDDKKKQKGRSVVNKPGTIIRKTNDGLSLSEVQKGDGGTAISDMTELGIGFTPIGIAIDITNAIEGTDRSGGEMSWAWRLAGLIPLVSEFKTSAKIAKVSGWVSRSVFQSLDPAIQKKVADAIKKGIVAPTGNSGIIKLTATEAKATGYAYKVEILGNGGDLRIYGNQQKNGHIVFNKVMGH